MPRLRWLRLTIGIASTILVATAARSEEAATPADCQTRPFRWQESCQALVHDPAVRGLSRLRAIPLSDDGSSWLTLGGEYRYKIEHLDEPSFGLRQTPAYVAQDHRWLAHADLRTSFGPRLFAQLSAAASRSREPRPRSFDRSALDLAQGFVDWPVSRGTSNYLLRIGRQELDLHGNRLISTREAANLRRAFDLASLSVARPGLNVIAFAGHPVQNRAGSFDDHADDRERFAGASIEFLPAAASRLGAISVFYFDRQRPRATYQDALGPEQRSTLGLRFARTTPRFDVAAQAAYQSGRVAGKQIDAIAIAGDVGVHAPGWRSRPRLALSFGIAGGDRHSGDDNLQTFDVIYPNLGYFTDAPIFYPGNTADIQPNVTARLSQTTAMQSGCDFIFRIGRSDAVYEPPGVPLARAGASASRHAATLCYVKGQWRPTSRIEVAFSYVQGEPGAVLRTAGGKSTRYAMVQVGIKL